MKNKSWICRCDEAWICLASQSRCNKCRLTKKKAIDDALNKIPSPILFDEGDFIPHKSKRLCKPLEAVRQAQA